MHVRKNSRREMKSSPHQKERPSLHQEIEGNDKKKKGKPTPKRKGSSNMWPSKLVNKMPHQQI